MIFQFANCKRWPGRVISTIWTISVDFPVKWPSIAVHDMSLRQDKSDVSHLSGPIGSLVHFIHNERMRTGRMGSTKGIFHG